MQTLNEAKNEFFQAIEGDGMDCPCCGRWGKINPYSFHYSMAVVLIELYKATRMGRCDKDGFLHVENYLVEIGSKIKGVVGKMKYWGLVEDRANDDEAKKTSGFWKITQRGVDFVCGYMQIPKKVWVFDDRVSSFSHDDQITIREALGEKFNYQEMMGQYYNPAKVREDGQVELF